MFFEAETWVAIGFVVFVAMLLSIGVHRTIGKALDDRSARIKAELDEARKLRDEAAGLLAEYQRKRSEAEGEAQEIVSGARAEAERLAVASSPRPCKAFHRIGKSSMRTTPSCVTRWAPFARFPRNTV